MARRVRFAVFQANAHDADDRRVSQFSATIVTAAKVPAELNGQIRVRLPIVGSRGPRNGERVQATTYDVIDVYWSTFQRSANDEDRVSILAACLAENSTLQRPQRNRWQRAGRRIDRIGSSCCDAWVWFWQIATNLTAEEICSG